MTIKLPNPPDPTGDNEKDIEELYGWGTSLIQKLRHILYNLDSVNITSLTQDKIVEEE